MALDAAYMDGNRGRDLPGPSFPGVSSLGQQSFHSSLRWPRYTQDPSTQEAEAEEETHREILAKTNSSCNYTTVCFLISQWPKGSTLNC